MQELTRNKSLLIIGIVIGSVAVLWPCFIYPIIINIIENDLKPNKFDKGCCEIIFERDLNAPQILKDICNDIVKNSSQLDEKSLTKLCQKEISDKCSINLTMIFFQKSFFEKSSINLLKKALLSIRSVNLTACFQNVFEINRAKFLDLLSDRIDYMNSKISNYEISRENDRNSFIRKTGIPHPGFSEKVRQRIPDMDFITTKQFSSRKRPPLPGAEKTKVTSSQPTSSFMTFICSVYTSALVMFSFYVGFKAFFRNKKDTYPEAPPNPEFQREVFLQTIDNCRRKSSNSIFNETKKIGDVEDLTELRKLLSETEIAMEQLISKINKKPTKSVEQGKRIRFDDEEQSNIKVVGFEASVNKENDDQINSDEESASELFPDPFKKNSNANQLKNDSPPNEVLLKNLPIKKKAQVIITETETENKTAIGNDNNNNKMVLSSKMILSVVENYRENDSSDDGDNEDNDEDIEKSDTQDLTSLHTAKDFLNDDQNTDDDVEDVSDNEI